MQSINAYIVLILFSQSLLSAANRKGQAEEENEAPNGVRDPKPCEVCKYLAVELQGRLDETAKIRGFIETGHGLDPKQKKRKEYKRSELRLIEALLEPHVCDKILEYNIHAERKKSLRYAKGQSETMKTLHGLVDKGVKVELGIPNEMWDQPSAEITNMQRSCFTLVEEYEGDIEDWYFGDQTQPLLDYLCKDRFLRGKETSCLDEEFEPKDDEEDADSDSPAVTSDKKTKRENNKGSRKKGDTGPKDVPPTPPSASDSVSPIPAPATEGDIKDEL